MLVDSIEEERRIGEKKGFRIQFGMKAEIQIERKGYDKYKEKELGNEKKNIAAHKNKSKTKKKNKEKNVVVEEN